jgi:DNA-directed RNA polymerase subunit RPC12/RpoP
MSDSNYQKCACSSCGGNIEFPLGSAGELIECPHCGAQTKLVSTPENSSAQATEKPAKVPVAILIVIVLVAVGAMILWLKTHQSEALPAVVVAPAITNVVIPKAFTVLNDFEISKITLKKSEEGGLVYAIGVVKNDTSRQRFGVKIELDVLNEQDAKIGDASDYVAILEPHQRWQFMALLTAPKAAKAVPTRIEEQK